MLPYPSGKLHMGHVRNYTINDMLARQLRMKGMNVLMPMGWDAFGLPAEKAAIKNKVPPAQWTYANIAHMKEQMKAMGLAIDWSREVATCDPGVLQVEPVAVPEDARGGHLRTPQRQIVNWDPVDMTGARQRAGHRRPRLALRRRWSRSARSRGTTCNITHYAEELLSGPSTNPADPEYLSGWPERVRLMQENWIGKSEGVRFAFPHEIHDETGAAIGDGKLYVFTTRADTIMGVTFCCRRARAPARHARRQGQRRRWPRSSKPARPAAPPRPSARDQGKGRACPPG